MENQMKPMSETEQRLNRIEDPTAPPTEVETDTGSNVVPEDSIDPNEGASLFGVFYPKHYIVTVFAERSAAESAASALEAAGFGADAINTWDGVEVAANHDKYVAERGILQKIGSLFPSEEHDVLNDYIDQARAGGTFLTVFTPEEGQRQMAAPIIADAGGVLMRYYGDNTITNLTLDDRSDQ
jgi:hypothetical protein